MERCELCNLLRGFENFDGKEVTVSGWARTVRDSKTIGFIELNDGSSFKCVQIVFEDGKVDNFKEIAKLNVGSAVTVTGTVVLTPEMRQPFEIHAKEITVEGLSTPDYPLQKKRHSVEFLAPSPIFAPAQIFSTPFSACVRNVPLQFMNFSTAKALFMPTPPSSPAATVKAPARCSG